MATTREQLQEELFAAFAEKHKTKLIWMASRITGGDRDLAEDAYQMAVLGWLKRGVFAFGKYTEAQRYTALKMKVRDRAIDIVRRRRGVTDAANLPFMEDRYKDHTHAPKPALVKGIEKLTEKQREAMRLVYEEGLGLSGAARKLGVSPQAVDQMVRRVHKRLRIDFVEIPKTVLPASHPDCLKCKAGDSD